MVLLQTSHRGALRAWCQEVGWKRSLLLEQDVPSVQLRQLRKRRVLSYSIPQITFFFFPSKDSESNGNCQGRGVRKSGWTEQGSDLARVATRGQLSGQESISGQPCLQK